jgi:hypothetical protein
MPFALKSSRLPALAAAWLVAVPALAQDQEPAATPPPAYVGTWAYDAAQCKTPQEEQGAPLVIAADRYDQHEAHCEFTSVTGAAPEWKIAADCTVEGSAQPLEFSLKASGDTLTMADDTGARDLVRCK